MPLKFSDPASQTAPAPVSATAASSAAPSASSVPSASTRPRPRKPRSRRSVLASLTPESVFFKPWFISQSAGNALELEYLMYLQNGGRPVQTDLFDDDEDDDDDQEPCDPDDPNCPPFPVTDDGLACIPVSGTLVKSPYAFAFPFATSYAGVTAMCASALRRGDVKGILFCHDSPGGSASGMLEACSYLYSVRDEKPMAAISDDSCYSASYALASTCPKLFLTQTAGVGSVGCWLSHADISSMLDKMGIKVTIVKSGEKKTDGTPTEPLPARVKADYQAEVDRLRGLFAQLVARNRSQSMDAIMGTEAGIYMAEQACPLLADQVGTMDDALDYLRGQVAKREATNPEPNPDISEPGDKEGPYTIHIDADTAAWGGEYHLNGAHATAVPSHSTATTDSSWDGPAEEKKLDSPMPLSTAKAMYAWYDGSAVDAGKLTKSDCKYPHHVVGDGGKPGAAVVAACRAIISNLNGARSKPSIPSSDRKGVYAHAKRHLTDAGVDAAPLKSEAELAKMLYFEHTDGELFGYDPELTFAQTMAANEFADLSNKHRQQYMRNCSLLFGLKDLKSQHPDAICTIRGIQYRASVTSSGKVLILSAPYDGSIANLGAFDEVYKPNCFRSGLTGNLLCLFNHAETSSYVLGSTSAGTARFWEDSQGLWAEATPPDTSWWRDLRVSIERGDITGASCAFWLTKQSWSVQPNGRKLRTVEEAICHDASIEVSGAYPNAHSRVEEEAAAVAAMRRNKHRLELNKRRIL